MNGFALSSILSTVLIFLLVYVWGSALGGIGAGIFSTGVLWMMAPMVLLPRFLTYYPPIVLATVLGATGLALWGRYRTPLTALLCGIGIAGCLLIDVRGVVWAVLFGLVVCVYCPLMSRRPTFCLDCFYIFRFGGLGLPRGGCIRPMLLRSRSNWMFVHCMLGSMSPILSFSLHGILSHRLCGGWFNPVEVLDTVGFIIEQRNYPVPQGFIDWQFGGWWSKRRDCILDRFWIMGVILGCVTVWRRKYGKSQLERILLFLCTLSPFLLLFHSLQSIVEQHIRFYMHTAPGLAVALGVGMAQSLPQFKILKYWHAVPQLVRTCIWFVLATGWLMTVHFVEQSPLYARAEWRYEWRINALDWSRINRARKSTVDLKPYDQTCADRLRNESMMPSIYP